MPVTGFRIKLSRVRCLLWPTYLSRCSVTSSAGMLWLMVSIAWSVVQWLQWCPFIAINMSPTSTPAAIALLRRCICVIFVKNTFNIKIQDGPKKLAHFFVRINFMRLNLPHQMFYRFSNLFHCLNKKNICNNTATKDPTIPQVCRYTTLWNVTVLEAIIENKTTSVATPFTELPTKNNVFIVSFII